MDMDVDKGDFQEFFSIFNFLIFRTITGGVEYDSGITDKYADSAEYANDARPGTDDNAPNETWSSGGANVPGSTRVS